MRYVVGYTATERGRDAVNLAAVIARTQGAELDLVMVDPEHSPYTVVYPPESGYRDLLEEQLETWLREGLDLVPGSVPAAGHIRNADSDAHGLIDAAEELGAGLIVVGAASNGIFKRFTIGSVANALLHAAPVPVALAPHGYSRTAPLTRITCAVGNRRGANDVLEAAVDTAARSGLPLRLVSLVALDAPSRDENAVTEARMHADDRLARAQQLAAGRCPVTAVVVQGRTIENAIDELEFDDGEVMLIGSSRLAGNNRLFLGATASKILRSLPVPMVVVPRNFRGSTTGTAPSQSEVTE
ncbi:universal stress protein [Arthrobacter sp. zg-ZUI100]|uniref:Universal stress protein n=1 Tax=Arthrobacter jiangjiafuii TaxID=2817475 RepID=A0A975M484_9MICC|nr:universal stress protein [Arthrobacter jiangjiafuii]MBP3035139.1 universal stress protein [Arthrobacter jiangjiafuii]MBP3042669.1 universal stress protein [Arthrobacter jiangjiafuii]QWC09607.1 universal stress protein [Arthrobacter jiangjiafuii]